MSADDYQRTFPIKNKTPRSSDFTIMIVGKIGKTRSFKISSNTLLCYVLFFSLCLLSLPFFINGYFNELRVNNDQREELKKIRGEFNDTKMALHRFKQHTTLLEEAIEDFNDVEKTGEKPTRPVKVETKKADPLVTSMPAEEMQQRPEQNQQLIIADPVFHKFDNKLTVNFKLVNKHPGNGRVRGYVHITAVYEQEGQGKFISFQKATLKEGLPVDYKLGQLFFIKRFKVIKGEYLLGPGIAFPSSIRVLVYDHSGELILQNRFKVNNDL